MAQEDAADHLTLFVVHGERDLPLPMGDVLEPASALIRRHAPRTRPYQQALGVVRPGLPGVDVCAVEGPHARARPARDDVLIGNGHVIDLSLLSGAGEPRHWPYHVTSTMPATQFQAP